MSQKKWQWFGKNEGFTVDTHVIRLANQWGLTKHGKNAVKVEKDLMKLFPTSTPSKDNSSKSWPEPMRSAPPARKWAATVATVMAAKAQSSFCGGAAKVWLSHDSLSSWSELICDMEDTCESIHRTGSNHNISQNSFPFFAWCRLPFNLSYLLLASSWRGGGNGFSSSAWCLSVVRRQKIWSNTACFSMRSRNPMKQVGLYGNYI